MASAKSVIQTTEQADALRDVAKYAVAMGYYGIAIEAGREIYSSSASSELLRDVAICAAGAERYEEAIRAATEIYTTTVHDDTMKTIVRIQGEQEQGGVADVLDVNLRMTRHWIPGEGWVAPGNQHRYRILPLLSPKAKRH